MISVEFRIVTFIKKKELIFQGDEKGNTLSFLQTTTKQNPKHMPPNII